MRTDNSDNSPGAECDIGEAYWHVNPGDEKIHATRVRGKFRNLKWFTEGLWLLFFIFPYVRYDGRQAVLFDIPARKFHIFGLTIWPQDVWMLSLVLLFLALTLFAVTAMASRVFCGYFCFQTAWTEFFTFIEELFEGSPPKRRKLDKAPWSLRKISIKTAKHTIWLIVSVLTGFTFAAYFTDVYGLLQIYITLTAPAAAWITLALFTAGTYILAGFMREQVCFWLCPYARIQGVMYDNITILPTYDQKRGEPRAKFKHDHDRQNKGDCIDCHLCVAVCPTGIDIRNGQQEGCITCGLCIDACNTIMDKTGMDRGLIRYASLNEIEKGVKTALYKHPRVLVYLFIITLAFSGIVYGLMNLKGVDFKVIRERQPMFVRLSDGSIQNKYTFKIVNKTKADLLLDFNVDGPAGAKLAGAQRPYALELNKVAPVTVFVRVPANNLSDTMTPLIFSIVDKKNPEIKKEYKSVFASPAKR